ncbi:MAG: hypothetical protein OIN87_06595 [Candidatus Methanoperedens sp.]|nr:hypothetical protein [Candidatus Methanoperedens sp.]
MGTNMIFSNNSKKIQNIIKKIENGNASESNIASLCELLETHKNFIQESVRELNRIITKGNLKASYLAIHTLNKLSENYKGLEYYSIYVLINCTIERKNELCECNMSEILEILSKITQKYPERMKIAVPELLNFLENMNPVKRTISFFILSILAIAHPEFFKGHSRELIRVLNGLYIDERIYACRLIKQLAKKDPTIVSDSYDIIEDMWLGSLDCNLRSEAGFALDALKEAEESSSHVDNPIYLIQKPMPSIVIDKLEISEYYFSRLRELRSTYNKELNRYFRRIEPEANNYQ